MSPGAPTSVDVSVIVPTYREAENLGVLIPRIRDALEPLGVVYEILIVDDDSRDGTDAVVTQMATTCPVRLIVRTQERDLSLAVLDGLRAAQGAALVVMDADHSHPPEALPALINALDTPPTDFVIGSRYVPGGRTEDWGGRRRLNSYVATLLCRPLTGRVTDPMAGFFAIARSTFQRGERFNPIGYKIGLELICRCACTHIAEVPITFRNRVHGQSKLSLTQQINYLIHLDRLYREFHRGWGFLARPALWLMIAILTVLRGIHHLVAPRRSGSDD